MSDDDVLAEALRVANPVPRSVSPTDVAFRATLLEQILNMPIETQPSRQGSDRRRFRYAAIVAGAAAAATVIVLIVAQSNDSKTSVTAPTNATVTPPPLAAGTETSAVGIGLGSCVEFYDLTTLTHREMAFDGTVQAVEGSRVTFNVSEWFKGGSGASVTLDGNGLTGGAITSAGGPTLSVGQRLLVAGDGGFVWSCGYTQAYNADVAASWRSALMA